MMKVLKTLFLSAIWLSALESFGKPECIKTAAQFETLKSALPEEFRKMPVYVTTDGMLGAAAIKVYFAGDILKVYAYSRKLGSYAPDDAYIREICYDENKKLTIDFENRPGTKEKEVDFEATYIPEKRVLKAFVTFKFATEAEYKKLYQRLQTEDEEKNARASEGSSHAR